MRARTPGRLLLAGVVAGVVFNVGGMASAFLTGLPETFARFGVAPSAGTALLHTGLRLGLGVATMMVYAGIRAGAGGGPGPAIRTGLLVWFIGYVPGSAVLHELGVLGDGQFAFALAWGVLEAGVATMAGARLLREPALEPGFEGRTGRPS